MNQLTTRRLILLVLIPFSILTRIALWTDGVVGIFSSIVSSWGALQIYVDLVISIAIILVWLYADAKKQGRNPWPWIVAALIVGTFSPLVYLYVRIPESS